MGRSEKGVYFTWICEGWLRVWILKECCGEVEWILKHENDLKPMLEPYLSDRPLHGHGPWVLEDINYNLFRFPEDDKKTMAQEKLEWEQDNGYDGVGSEDMDENFFLEENENQDIDHDGVISEDVVENFYLEDNENWDTGHDGVKSEGMVEDIYSEDKEKAIVVENINMNFANDGALGNGCMVEDCCLLDDMEKVTFQKKSEWNSNNDNSLDDGDRKAKEYFYGDTKILGFHPFKEIIFLSESFQTGLAYHLNGSEMEVLGNIYPKEYASFKELANEHESFHSSFVYMPCRIDEFRDGR
ncbi:uncharacterized protein LOC112268739 [Brachypodium distachyon]|uniref:uncharacterized protein LOC112268739 n=1 Tax=Brachypodium distachyon TaxID=15368 RepID=UPI000D0CCB64|nr:uncharacterized protein LOC112268739 [Brachypodium distachyon]XP_024310558.1 uncharacterized protein LOC112268739 [Brachypodium distachyon]|eukprot:XP_024310557.1 uncharacterized protein LOC112268739 [Brachypodium distachyon]